MAIRLAIGVGITFYRMAVSAGGDPDARLAAALNAHQGASTLLTHATIRLKASGAFELGFDSGLELLERPTLLEDVQQAYTAGLPPGEEAEFVVRQTRPGHYWFVNRRGQHSRIEEVHREQLSATRFALVLHAEGERWFGNFESLIRIEIRSDAGDGACRYRVDVDAYPHSALLRGMARLGPIKRFFERKLIEIVGISLDVVNSLAQQTHQTESPTTLTSMKLP